MSVLIGVLLDVSGSMERSVGAQVKEEGGSWARSVFKVVDDLIKNDVSQSNQVFAIGVGASDSPEVFDLLTTLKKATASSSTDQYERSHASIIEEGVEILEINGAPNISKWASTEDLCRGIGKDEAIMVVEKLNDPNLLKKFVSCLPLKCRQIGELVPGTSDSILGQLFTGALDSAWGGYGWVGGKLASQSGVDEEIEEVMGKWKALIIEDTLTPVGKSAMFPVQQAQEILHGCVGTEELTDDRVDTLMEKVRPIIFGGTPLIRALNEAKDLFSLPQYENHHKLLFVLSDGEPADGNVAPVKALSDLGVHTVGCFITDRDVVEPLRLYSVEQQSWEKPAEFMFKLSSTITTQLIPRTIFIKRGWKIDITNNETRLFAQVNNPDIIADVCDLARNVVCCQDALSDILSTVSLDLYINQANDGFSAKDQVGDTCYANASAAVIHLSTQRIVGRDGGYPDFFVIRQKLIDRYGEDGANTFRVLQEVCPLYRLHCEKVDVLGALKAVAAKRSVLARFRLTEDEWDSFSEFYDSNPKGILTQCEVNISRRPRAVTTSGHAVVLTSYSSDGLRLMNSWGSNWADGGFFRVKTADVLGLEFFDVFWTLDDLSQAEKRAYKCQGPKIASQLMDSLRGLQRAVYRCPLCRAESKVVDYTGHVLEARCPRCRRTFSTRDADADDLALNLYLTSLAHKQPA